MNQGNRLRIALAAPIMLAVLMGSGAARAQADDQETAEQPMLEEAAEEQAVDASTVDELMRVLAQQQRQIDDQQSQLQLLASMLNNMQQQLESVQQTSGRETAESGFRNVLRQRARGQEEVRISGARPNRLGRIVVHRAGKTGRSGL